MLQKRKEFSRGPALRNFQVLVVIAVTVLAFPTLVLAQTFSVVYNFGSSSSAPISPTSPGVLAQGQDGNLYGTAPLGGINGKGAVYQMTPAGAISVIHSFDGSDGCNAVSGLTLGNDGNLYGTAANGGEGFDGTVFVVSPTGAFTDLHDFRATDGRDPTGPPIQGKDGNYYGTTSGGGTNDDGTVYKMSPSGGLTSLYSFDNTHGKLPMGALLQGRDSNFYGVAGSGGKNDDDVIFKITSAGKLKVLFNFDDTHGSDPVAGLLLGADGNFYGTASRGGNTGLGTIFKMTPAGAVTVLHNFGSFNDGSLPAGIVEGTDGFLYGTAVQGGTEGFGMLYRIAPDGSNYMHDFDQTDGEHPDAAVIQNTNGVIYGTTNLGGSVAEGVFFSVNENLAAYVSLNPSVGKAKATVQILGQGLSGATQVLFNGTAAKFTLISDTYMTAIVPAAATTGYVKVVTPRATIQSGQLFYCKPTVTGFTPSSGPIGTSVRITGTSLSGASAVAFGGVVATSFTVNSNTQITAAVPAKAKTGKIKVTAPEGSATSKLVFAVNWIAHSMKRSGSFIAVRFFGHACRNAVFAGVEGRSLLRTM
jgi:uncharacterized repeat protein (TIGR03803 family)